MSDWITEIETEESVKFDIDCEDSPAATIMLEEADEAVKDFRERIRLLDQLDDTRQKTEEYGSRCKFLRVPVQLHFRRGLLYSRSWNSASLISSTSSALKVLAALSAHSTRYFSRSLSDLGRYRNALKSFGFSLNAGYNL